MIDPLLRELVQDSADSALLVIDMQNAFCHPAGGLARAGRNIDPQRSIIPIVGEIVRAARRAQLTIIWTQQENIGTKDRSRVNRRVIPKLQRNFTHEFEESFCVRGTWDAEIVEELQADVAPGDDVVRKHKMSAFYCSTLDALLRMREIKTLIVIGISSYVCVESTIRDASYRGLDIVVVADAVAGSDDELHRATLKKVERYFGLLVDSVDLIHALEGTGKAARHPA